MWSIGWFGGAVGGLLVTGLGLELLAHQVFGATDVATLTDRPADCFKPFMLW